MGYFNYISAFLTIIILVLLGKRCHKSISNAKVFSDHLEEATNKSNQKKVEADKKFVKAPTPKAYPEIYPKIDYLSSLLPKERLKYFKNQCKIHYQPYKTEFCDQDFFKPSKNRRFSDHNFVPYAPVFCANNSEKQQQIVRNEYELFKTRLVYSNKKRTHPWFSYNFLLDRRRKFTVCMPEKSGCTLYQRFWFALNKTDLNYLNPKTVDQNVKGLDDKDPYEAFSIYRYTPRLSKLHDFSPSDEDILNDEWKRVINIRHPFERLYSGYRDKFYVKNIDCPRFVKSYKKSIDNYEKNKSHPMFGAKDCSTHGNKKHHKYMVSFHAFLRYILSTPFTKINQHFLPISHICTPCDVDWDYISTQPTINDDIFTVFQNFAAGNSSSDRDFINKVRSEKDSNDLISFKSYPKSKTAKMAFYNISQKKGGKGLIQNLYNKFEWDFLLFGYELDGYLWRDGNRLDDA